MVSNDAPLDWEADVFRSLCSGVEGPGVEAEGLGVEAEGLGVEAEGPGADGRTGISELWMVDADGGRTESVDVESTDGLV